MNLRKHLLLFVVVFCAVSLVHAERSASGTDRLAVHFPQRTWETRTPEQVGLDATQLAEAIEFAVRSENEKSRDLRMYLTLNFAREPHGEIVGPVKNRGPASGVIIRKGYVVAEWGEPRRVDMTFSISKSFLSTVVGLAYDRGLIESLDDPVRHYVPTDHFDSEHNRDITWNQLLRQTSDWQGTLWGKPDWADRPVGDDSSKWPDRELHEPGTHYKYNDVRVNLLAFAALHVWRRPLPQVLREHVMDPIGASNTWRWHGYDNSWITLDGSKVQSVSGGGHWGGGMFISARDLARFGYLLLRDGQWEERQLLSPEWLAMARTPTGPQPTYGFMNYFLNTDGKGRAPSAPRTAVLHLGAGTNVVYVDPDNDIVAVVRWIETSAIDGFVQRLLAAIEDE